MVPVRTYMVVIDESDEARVALRFAAQMRRVTTARCGRRIDKQAAEI